MNNAQMYPLSLSINEGCQRRLGASADQVSRLYYDNPDFRTLWDDYVVCQLGLQHWTSSKAPQAEVRQLEYVQTIYDLEWEIRKHLEKSWDAIQDLVGKAVFGSAREILTELRERHGVRGREVYLAALFPLIEMAWLGQTPARETRQFIAACGEYVCTRMGLMAGGLEVLSEAQLDGFLTRYLECPAEPTQLRQLSELGMAYLRSHSNKQLVLARERAIWRCSYRIASGNLLHVPNSLQWTRLLDLLPDSVSWRDFQTLAKAEITDLMADLEHAWEED